MDWYIRWYLDILSWIMLNISSVIVFEMQQLIDINLYNYKLYKLHTHTHINDKSVKCLFYM